MIDKKKKAQVIKKFATHEGDTGSSEVQIALLTEEIKNLTEHLKKHKKDFSSRRGLLRKVSERRKLLRYLERENAESFSELVKKLKLKVAKRLEDPEKILADGLVPDDIVVEDELEIEKSKVEEEE